MSIDNMAQAVATRALRDNLLSTHKKRVIVFVGLQEKEQNLDEDDKNLSFVECNGSSKRRSSIDAALPVTQLCGGHWHDRVSWERRPLL